MERMFSADFVRVTELAAIECARTMGRGDRRYSDHIATETMRKAMDDINMRGTVVIGEGERDEAPMLYVGEKVGGGWERDENSPEIDIAVDPLEGTNLVATGSNNAITVLAASEKGGLLYAPDIYLEKLIVGPSAAGKVDLDAPVEENLKIMAKALNREVEDIVIIVLDRARHEALINDIRKAGARIKLIGDGDLSAGISAAVSGSGVHGVMGIGGAPEGVLTAAALRCLGGEILARFAIMKQKDRERLEETGITDPTRIYSTKDLACGEKMLFVATGVTEGYFLKGVHFFGDGIRTHSIIMSSMQKNIRFVDTIHVTHEVGSLPIRL